MSLATDLAGAVAQAGVDPTLEPRALDGHPSRHRRAPRLLRLDR